MKNKTRCARWTRARWPGCAQPSGCTPPPATLRKAIGGAKEMFGRDGGRTFSHEADVNPAAGADTYNLPFKD